MTNNPETSKPTCALYAIALPELRAGSLTSFERQALHTHLQECTTCYEQAEADSMDVIGDAVRRHYGIPAEAAPFLTLDDIRLRAAVSTPSDLDEQSDTHANDVLFRIVDRGVIMQTKRAQHATPLHSNATETKGASRWHTTAAIVSVIALVAVFALVMHSFAMPQLTKQQNPATRTTHPHAWVEQYTVHDAGGPIVIAPGDPSVIYRLPNSISLTFQRSDDSGKTWTSYTAPSQEVGSNAYFTFTLQVTPLNAKVIFATIDTDQSNPYCSQAGNSPVTNNQMRKRLAVAGGSYSCTYQYVSTDGGSTWTTPVVPTEGYLGQFYFTGGSDLTPPFVAQGGRLYTSLASDITTSFSQGFRLVSSTDGIHWSAADAPLVARNLMVYEYAATPDGSTIFATTLPLTSAREFNRELWRSDDAGSHWTDLGAFPVSQIPEGTTYLLGAGNAGSNAVVYYATAITDSAGGSTPSPGNSVVGIAPDNVYASLDDGKTWQAASAANIPGNERAALFSFGTLDNGSLVLMFDTWRSFITPGRSPTASIAFYAWKLGDKTWTPLSPSLAVPASPLDTADQGLTTAHNGSPATIWALTENGGYTLWTCSLG